MTTPFVSVIIPVYNDSKRLTQCLESLEYQTYPQENYEIIVVDNNSTEDLKSIVSKFKQAQYEFESIPGSYAARNKGLSVAKGDIIGFTDSDCIPTSEWIETAAQYLVNHPSSHYIAGQIKIFFKNPDKPSIPELYDSLNCLNQEHYITKQHFGATANLFVRKDLFKSVGLFNANLKSGGDKELGHRTFKAGYQQDYLDDMTIYHPARDSSKAIKKKTIRVMRGHCKIENKHQHLTIALIKEMYFDFKPPVKETIEIFRSEQLNGFWNRLSYTLFFLYIGQVKAYTKAAYYFNSIVLKAS